jgi:REP element-mobilizing transposase RayT
MTYDPNRHHRQSIRLRGFDYTQTGAYFVTIVIQNREHLLGEIVNGVMRLNDYGRIVLEEWNKLPTRFPHVTLDVSAIMPNHLHGIFVITADGKGKASAKQERVSTHISSADALPLRPMGTVSGSLGAIVQNLKSTSSRRVNALRDTPGAKLWQRNYYERIIRHDRELNAIRQYIIDNPMNWESDREG